VVPAFLSFALSLSSYLSMKLFYDSGLQPEAKCLPKSIFGALILRSFLVGSRDSSAYTASVNSTAKTFPDNVVSEVNPVNLAVTLVELS
jgi:hypothetical protein